MHIRYSGNCPKVVNKDAKYSVVHGAGDQMVVRLIYVLNKQERALLTTEEHQPLVEMVNAVKEEQNDQRGGAFYINEYGLVLVPTKNGYFVAGPYDRLLEFEFEGLVIGPKAPKDVAAGQEWKGPHVGIPYVLTADGRDIRYEAEVRPQVIRRERLRDAVGASRAARLAQRLAIHKPSGGRIYINEARELFAPVEEMGKWKYIYLGNLGDDAWFPSPVEVPS